MASLLNTLIKTASVATLATSTILFTGTAQGKSLAEKEAATQISQGNDIIGAMTLFNMENNRWPNSLEELESQEYLNSIPRIGIAAAPQSSQKNAKTLGSAWEIPLPGVPVAWVKLPQGEYSTSVCKEINRTGMNYQGILKFMQRFSGPQCFGKNLNSLRVVVPISTPDLEVLVKSSKEGLELGNHLPIFNTSDPAWLVAPPEKKR